MAQTPMTNDLRPFAATPWPSTTLAPELPGLTARPRNGKLPSLLGHSSGSTTPAIFLDRDGVLNENRDAHVTCWSEFSFIPGVLTALRILASLPYPIIGITNQAIVQRGLATAATIDEIHRRMRRTIEDADGRLDGIYYCPHDSVARCACRKPQPGLLFTAAEELGIDLARSVFVGDAVTDLEAGRHAGCRTVLVLSGRGSQSLAMLTDRPHLRPSAIARDLLHAIPVVMELLGAQPTAAGHDHLYTSIAGGAD